MITRRDFYRQWAPMFVLFNFFGLAHFTLPYRGSCCNSLGSFLLRLYILCVRVHLAFITLFTLINVFTTEIGGLNGFMKKQIFVAQMMAYLVTFIESSATVGRQKQLLRQIHQIGNIISHQLQVEISIKQFCRRWMWKCWCSIGLIALLLVLTMAMFAGMAWDAFAVFWFPMLVDQVRLMQVSVFVDVVAEMLAALVMAMQSGLDGNGISDSELIACMDVYGKLFKIVGLINSTFGRSLIPIFGLKLTEWLSTTYWSMFNAYTVNSLELDICEFILGYVELLAFLLITHST